MADIFSGLADFNLGEIPLIGNMGDFVTMINDWVNKGLVVSELELIGIFTIGAAVVVIFVALTGISRAMRPKR